MTENPVELIVATFDQKDRVAEVLDELKELERMKLIATGAGPAGQGSE